MEEISREGRVKSIGVINFNMQQLEELISHAEIIPVVN
jgi:diketogulonate reductase-like aldo/keto reductase